MKNSLLRKTAIIVLCTALLLSCDIVKDDVVPDGDLIINSQLATFAEKPAVVNLSAVSGGRDLDIKNLESPKYGDFKVLTDTEDKKFLVYTPNEDFFGQFEKLQIELEDITDNKIAKLNLNVRSLDNGGECNSASGIYDYAQIAPGESVQLDLLDNDVFCGVGYNGGYVNMHDIQNSDGVNISIGPGRIANLTYTAPEDFTGKVVIIYDLGINWVIDATHIDNEDIKANPQIYFEAFTTAMVEIDVTNN